MSASPFARFRANKRGWWSLWIFVSLYVLSLCAELVSADPSANPHALFKSGPHTVWGAEEIEPWLRPVSRSDGRWPVAAAQYAFADDGEPVLESAWGDTDRFSGALRAKPPAAVVQAMKKRWRGEASEAFETEESGVSWRLAPAEATATGRDKSRVYLRSATWRTDAPEKVSEEGTSGPMEQAVFPFRPVPGHPFGFDAAGRDVFARVLYGTRTAITFGLVLSFSSMLAGIFFGAIQGFFVRWVDLAGQRLTEIWSAIPFLYVMIFLGNAFGRSFGLLLAVYAAFNWMGVAAYVRAEFLRLKPLPFVEAARVQGLSSGRIMFRHVLPNAMTPLVTVFPFLLVGSIASLAALDYLGFGLPDGAPSWGELLQQAQSFRHAWWLVLWPSAALFFTMLLGVFVGEALRDAFDPKPLSALDREKGSGRSSAHGRTGNPTVSLSQPDTAEQALEIEDLHVSFDTPRGIVEAVSGVSLAIRPGETLGLVGESGCGKSVTAMSVLRLLPSPPGRIVAGAIRIAGCEVSAMSLPELRKIRGGAVGMVFQDPMTALSPLRRVGEQMLEALRLHKRVSRREGLRIAQTWLEKCGLRDAKRCLGEYPFRLSGGMQQRIMIATALMTEPALVIADEPTTALDTETAVQILDLLKSGRNGKTALLLVTHDMSVVRRACDRVAVMYAGQIVETGTVDEVLHSPCHPYSAALLDSLPSRHPPGGRLPAMKGSVPSPLAYPPGCRFSPRCERAAADCSSSIPALGAAGHCAACFHPLDGGSVAGSAFAATPTSAPDTAAKDDAAVAIECEKLSKTFAETQAVCDVTLAVRSGETLGLVGSSGCGKTTLLRMLSGLETPSSGEIFVGGSAAAFDRSREMRRQVQMVFQDPFSALNPRLRISDAICEGAIVHGLVARRDSGEFAARWLLRVGLSPDVAGRFPHELSGGQLQRVSIARALALEPKVLLLDEPVSALDVSVQAQILNLLSDIKRDLAPSMILVTHDLGVVRSVADRVAVMDCGKIVETGTVRQIFSSPAHRSTKALLAAEGRV